MRREWQWAAAVAVAVMVFTTVPYVFAAAQQGAAWRFSGTLLAVEDGNSYIADLRQGAAGAWLFTLPYSTERHPPVLIYAFYLVLGKLAGTRHEALVAVFHAARFAGGVALLLVSYRFLAELLPGVRQRRLGLLLVALGGGLGWALALLPAPLFGSLPIDFISPEAYSFLVLFSLPHLALARCCLLLGLLAYLRGQGVWAGLAWLGTGFLQPLYVPVAWLVIAADIALEFIVSQNHFEARVGITQAPVRSLVVSEALKRRVAAAVWAGLLSAPMLVYTLVVLSADPTLVRWNAQNRLPSPHVAHYLLGYGVWLVPALLGWRSLWRANRRLALFVGGWLLLAPVLLYLPIPTQRRLIEGVQLPLAALAVWGLSTLAERGRAWATAVMVGLVVPTTFLLWTGALVAASRPGEPIFVPADQVAVFDWLAEQATPGQAALAAYDTGNALPAYTPLTAYIGHGPETIGLDEKKPRVARFYAAGTPDAERLALLAEGGIRYVLFGPHERALGTFDPSSTEYLQLAYTRGAYAVYTVVP
jgi:hypothetical protein